MSTTITILTFGTITDITGKSNFALTDISSTDELQRKLETTFPGLENIKYTIAVNKQMVTTPTQLQDGATVAILPPFSGG